MRSYAPTHIHINPHIDHRSWLVRILILLVTASLPIGFPSRWIVVVAEKNNIVFAVNGCAVFLCAITREPQIQANETSVPASTYLNVHLQHSRLILFRREIPVLLMLTF